jgi:hypothetical protein
VIQYLWFALVGVLLVFVWRSGTFANLVARVTKVSASASGLDFEFTETSALKTKDSVESSLAPIRATIDSGVEADVRATSLQEVFGSILDGLMGDGQYRATVHIPDPLLDNWLYQVLDYHPRGEGRGRRFDSRMGLIGRAWRTGITEPLRQADGLTIDELIKDWSMTRREAAARKVETRKSLLAAVLHDTDGCRRVGILYLDSDEPNRFGADVAAMKYFGDYIARKCQPHLTTPLTDLVTKALRQSPQIVLERLS